VEKATWLPPIVVVPKKNGKLRIYVDFHKSNATTTKKPAPISIYDEVFKTMVGHEVYLFLDGYYGYHDIIQYPLHKRINIRRLS
jgi:hypothetical protein